MANEKNSEFTVTDKRKFTIEGELKPDVQEERTPEPAAEKPTEKVVEMKRPAVEPPQEVQQQPPSPSADEQKQQADAYSEQTKKIDERLQKELDQRNPGRKTTDFEMTFEKFVASLYMTALMQLGLVHEQGMQPHADIMGARQTIDTISLLKEKTKGNLTQAEELLIQNCLYELRMAYVEVTNALTRPPQGPIDPKAGIK